ncbi:MAG TPA: hypothetical protein VLE53_12550 [Gemmatimonadaceae bacterium]|nr:hypothetical protein [Gemmatimonadaceae bacterium]
MSRLLRAALALAVGVFAFVPQATAQQVPVRELPRPAREIEDPFSLITGAMELKPGQIILYDGVDGELVIVNFADGSRTPLGRQGSGPGEYKSIAGLFRVPGDTIWALDAAQMRVVVFTPDLKPGTTFPFMMFDAQAGTALTAPFQSDGRGRVYSSAMKIQAGGGRGAMSMQFPDSVGVVRLDPRAATERTEVARVRFPMSGNPKMQQNGNSFKYSMAYPGLVAADAWAVFNDGRIVIVRGATYAVEILGPDGRTTASVRIPYDRIPVTDADKKAEMDEAKRQMEEQGKAAQKMMPAGISMEFELLPPASWPDAYPPVAPLGALAAPNGDLWVRRAIPIRVGREQWDVLDRTGKLVARWRLPARTTIVAVGQGVVYAVRTDEDDLRYVQRVELPR